MVPDARRAAQARRTADRAPRRGARAQEGAGADEAMLTAKLVEAGVVAKLIQLIEAEPAAERSDTQSACEVLGCLHLLR